MPEKKVWTSPLITLSNIKKKQNTKENKSVRGLVRIKHFTILRLYERCDDDYDNDIKEKASFFTFPLLLF